MRGTKRTSRAPFSNDSRPKSSWMRSRRHRGARKIHRAARRIACRATLGQPSPALLPETLRPPGPHHPCECERASGASIGQALHLMNSPALQAKLSPRSRCTAARLAGSGIDDDRVVETLIHRPSAVFPLRKSSPILSNISGPAPNHAVSGSRICCGHSLNSQEFVFNH